MGIKEEVISLLKKYNIIKSEEPQEEMVSYEVVYEPDVIDTHGHWMGKTTLEKACENFNKNLKEGVVKSNLFHASDTDTFTVVGTWIQKELDVRVEGTDQQIKAGTWVAKVKYNDTDLWELKKAGIIGGVSIGAVGVLNEDTGEITEISFDGIPDEEGEE